MSQRRHRIVLFLCTGNKCCRFATIRTTAIPGKIRCADTHEQKEG